MQRQNKYTKAGPTSEPLQKALAAVNATVPTRGKPNKTEAEYGRRLALEFPCALIIFEGLRLTMNNGHSYRPDWFVWDSKTILCVEVKARGTNGFRMPSYQSAKIRFDQCVVEFPSIKWRWAEKHKGKWDVKNLGG